MRQTKLLTGVYLLIILIISVLVVSCKPKFVEELSPEGTIEPEDPEKSGLYGYSDYPLDSVPPTPISLKYLVEHRSALNEKVVTVSGIVVGTLLGEKACPQDIGGLGVGMCAQPRIFLADTNEEDRDKNYDVMLLVSEEEKVYKVGEKAGVKGIVYSSKTSLHLQKIY